MPSVPDTDEFDGQGSSQGHTQNITIERLRRDNINDKIQEILSLIPTEYFEEYQRTRANTSSTETDYPSECNTPAQKVKASGTKDGKPNKGQILTQAVQYIIQLQNEIDTNNRAEVDMLTRIQELSKQNGIIINDINLENTIAEEMLAKIGVGPLSEQSEPQPKLKEKSEPQSSQKFEYGGYSEYGDGS